MSKAGIENYKLPKGIIVAFPKPSEVICRRYMLACENGQAHVVCMPNLNTSMIDSFVADMIEDKKDYK